MAERGSIARAGARGLNRTEAFLRQARSDLSVYTLLQERGFDKCQKIQYLQMAGEKLAKSESEEAEDGRRPGLSHFGFSRWLRVLSVSNAEIRSLGFRNATEFGGARIGLLRTADAVEQLAPKIANDRALGQTTYALWNGVGTNAEYPWERVGGDPVAPVDYEFDEPELSDVRLHKFARLIDARIVGRLGGSRTLL